MNIDLAHTATLRATHALVHRAIEFDTPGLDSKIIKSFDNVLS